MQAKFGDPNMTAEQVSTLQEIIVNTGADSHIESMISRLTESSLSALKHGGISTLGIKLLTDLAIIATNRKI
jgi:geranylgeranyl diphosphate synthase type I